MTRTLTPKRAMVLDFIKNEVRLKKQFPTARAIADYMLWSECSARDVLTRLTITGHLTRERVPHNGSTGYRYVYSLGEGIGSR